MGATAGATVGPDGVWSEDGTTEVVVAPSRILAFAISGSSPSGRGSIHCSKVPFFHLPFRALPRLLTWVPMPCCLPANQMPTHLEPSGHAKTPGPCFLSLSYFPSKYFP